LRKKSPKLSKSQKAGGVKENACMGGVKVIQEFADRGSKEGFNMWRRSMTGIQKASRTGKKTTQAQTPLRRQNYGQGVFCCDAESIGRPDQNGKWGWKEITII